MKKLLFFPLFLAVFTPVQGAETYRTYRNARFGFALDVPIFLIAKPEAANGDGRHFVSRDGKISLRVFGSQNPNSSLSAARWRAVRDWRRDGARVTYSKNGANYYVVSGFVGTDIFYEKTVAWNGKFHTLIWEYPPALKKRLDAPVTRSVRSFTPRNFRVSRAVSVEKVAPAPKPTPIVVIEPIPMATPVSGY